MTQLRQRYDELKSAGGEVVMVSFASLDMLQRYVRELRLPFICASDVERGTYRAYGVIQGSALQVYNLKVLWGYAKMIFGGERLRKPVGTVLQLGGDFVVDKEGIVKFAYRSKAADDRPPVDELVRVVRSLP